MGTGIETKDSNGHSKPTRDEALIALREDRVAREQACLAEVKEVLQRHGCTIQAMPVIQDGLIKAVIQINAAD